MLDVGRGSFGWFALVMNPDFPFAVMAANVNHLSVKLIIDVFNLPTALASPDIADL